MRLKADLGLFWVPLCSFVATAIGYIHEGLRSTQGITMNANVAQTRKRRLTCLSYGSVGTVHRVRRGYRLTLNICCCSTSSPWPRP